MKKRKIFLFVAALAAAAALSACALSKDDVKLIDEDQAKELAEQNTSTWEYKGSIKDDDENMVKYNFTDTELGFDFAVISRASGRGLDGAAFYYDNNTFCDWEDHYSETVYNNCKNEIESICEASGLIGAVGEKPFAVSVVIMDDSAAEDHIDVYSEVCSCIEKADVRGKYKNMQLRIANTEGEGHRLGFYTSEGGYVAAEDELVDNMMADAEKRIGSTVKLIGRRKCDLEEFKSEEGLDRERITCETPLWDDAWEKLTVLELEADGRKYKMVNIEVDGVPYLIDEDGKLLPSAEDNAEKQ